MNSLSPRKKLIIIIFSKEEEKNQKRLNKGTYLSVWVKKRDINFKKIIDSYENKQ